MRAGVSHLGFPLVVVALVAHVLGILLFVRVWAVEDGFLRFGKNKLGMLMGEFLLGNTMVGLDLFFGGLLHLDQVEELANLISELWLHFGLRWGSHHLCDLLSKL